MCDYFIQNIVALLLFISIFIAITFANSLTKPIINLIRASENISKGNLETKVSEIKTDQEFTLLNKNFNNMIETLKTTEVLAKEGFRVMV